MNLSDRKQILADAHRARMADALAPAELQDLDACWRAANYLSVGQIFLWDNPLLTRPLTLADVKPMLLGHWGTTPGQNFVYAHLNRVIKAYDLDMICVSGPGHGGPAVVANTYLEGTRSEVYPDISRDEAGLKNLFRQFSFPDGIPSHASPECPGSIHEGGELRYSLSHSFGAVFDNPDLIVACMVGDGEAETGPLATACHSNKFLDPLTDGAVLPILHLNGYKISNPTVLARITHQELEQFLSGCGWMPIFVEGHEPAAMHALMAAAMGANPHANGGLLLRELHLPDYREYAAQVPVPGAPGIGIWDWAGNESAPGVPGTPHRDPDVVMACCGDVPTLETDGTRQGPAGDGREHGDYEGLRSADIRQNDPGWNIWRDGCPGGESPADVSERADRLIARVRRMQGTVALFTHGQFGAALATRWIGRMLVEGQHFALNTASVSLLGIDPHHPDRRTIELWNELPASNPRS